MALALEFHPSAIVRRAVPDAWARHGITGIYVNVHGSFVAHVVFLSLGCFNGEVDKS